MSVVNHLQGCEVRRNNEPIVSTDSLQAGDQVTVIRENGECVFEGILNFADRRTKLVQMTDVRVIRFDKAGWALEEGVTGPIVVYPDDEMTGKVVFEDPVRFQLFID